MGYAYTRFAPTPDVTTSTTLPTTTPPDDPVEFMG
jgi:hypothetical protein